MNRVAIYTQRHVIQRPPGGNITGKWPYEKMRTWNQNGIPQDHDMPYPAALTTYDQAEHENRVRASEIAPEGSIVFQIRRINPVIPDRAWMAEGTEGVEHVRRVITRDDDAVRLQGENGKPIRLSLVVLPSLDGQAPTMGGLPPRPEHSQQLEIYGVAPRSRASIYDNAQAGPSNGERPTRHFAEAPSFQQTPPSRPQMFDMPLQNPPVRPQPRQQADTWSGIPRSSGMMYGNWQAGPSNGEPAPQYMPETPSFPQVTPPHAQIPGMTPHMSRSFTPNMRQNQQPDLNQFGMPGIILDAAHREVLSRPSMRRPRNPLPTGPMGPHSGGNGGGDRSGFRPRQPVAPGNEASQMPSASRLAMPQPHEPNDLRRDLQGTTLPETIELLSSSDDDDDQELEERRKRRRFN
ncbi:hypothetical protein KC333_g8016 [Hortaea werneckii]|nr:hypothetical protein KC333_g8016 [Hortaea werneckii]KAI7314229.1 hypothetical protein KC326_g5134 [Hortaea werneckii]